MKLFNLDDFDTTCIADEITSGMIGVKVSFDMYRNSMVHSSHSCKYWRSQVRGSIKRLRKICLRVSLRQSSAQYMQQECE